MPTDTRSRTTIVDVALARSSNLPMLPEIAVKVLQLANNPHVTMSTLAEVIDTSPELCARILRIVNSAFYGVRGEVRSIERATTLMGLESVRNVTIAASLTRVFQGRPLSARFAPRDLWTHSVSVAAAMRRLALATRPGLAEEAFVAGMLHDIGLMMELQMDRVKLGIVLASMEAEPRQDLLAAEEAIFGATHEDFGAALLTAWGLPAPLAVAAQYHHHPQDVPVSHRVLPLMVQTADRLVAACAPPFLLEDPYQEIAAETLDLLRLSRAQLEELLEALPDDVAEIHAVLNGF